MSESEDTHIASGDEDEDEDEYEDDTRSTAFGPNDYFIAVMGVTGVGKSSFIQHLSAESVEVGHSLDACTQEVTFFPVEYKRDVTIWLLDTPGFDDTNKTDTQVLKEISDKFTSPDLYKDKKSKLDGIIYLHRIADRRMTGSAQANLFTFQKLCGRTALNNVILATTMWDQVTQEVGDRRESELITTDRFWGGMIKNGSTVLRHLNTPESAMGIIERLIQPDQPREGARMVLDLQKELVDRKLDLDQTGAGKQVDHGLAKARDGFKAKIEDLEEDLKSAREMNDKKVAAAVLEQRSQLEVQMQQVVQQQEDLKVNFHKLYEEKLAAMQQRIDYLENNPMVRSHPARESFGPWTASVSLFGANYWFNSLKRIVRSKHPDVPMDCLTEKAGHNNRCVALGEDNSWYIHYRTSDEQKTRISVFSDNFEALYPGAYRFLNEDHKNERPICVSLSTKGHYFVRTESGFHQNLPQSVTAAVGDLSSKESLWLGADDTWICQWYTASEDGKQKNYEWSADLKGHYNGMLETIEDSPEMIRALALNPIQSEQWVALWEDGYTSYGPGKDLSFAEFEYQEWCTRSFGTRWTNRRPHVGEAAEVDLSYLLLTRLRRRLKPWKHRYHVSFVPPRRWRRRDSDAIPIRDEGALAARKKAVRDSG